MAKSLLDDVVQREHWIQGALMIECRGLKEETEQSKEQFKLMALYLCASSRQHFTCAYCSTTEVPNPRFLSLRKQNIRKTQLIHYH